MRQFDRICVFCGASEAAAPVFHRAAEEMGATLAERGIELVYGGAAVGLMRDVADAALAKGGKVTGVLPEGIFAEHVRHPHLTDLRLVSSMHERKALMYQLADAFVALPGGLGTLEELTETLTWAQLHLHAKPVGVLNVDGYYEPLLAFLDGACTLGLMSPENRELLVSRPDVKSLLADLAIFDVEQPTTFLSLDQV